MQDSLSVSIYQHLELVKRKHKEIVKLSLDLSLSHQELRDYSLQLQSCIYMSLEFL